MAHFLRRNKNWLLLVAVMLALAPGALAPYLAYLTPPPLEYPILPFTVETPVVKVGESPTIAFTRCNHEWRVMPYTTTRRLEDVNTGIMRVLDTSTNLIQPGCETVKARGLFVPRGTPPGRYRITGISEAQGAWRTVYVWLETESFEVIDNDE